MTWTRLLYIRDMPKALTRVIPGQPRPQLPISTRYKAQIRKQFRLAGVPWLYQLQPPRTEHHRDRKPKQSKRSILQQERIQKIQKNLAQNDKKMLQFRQTKLDSRPLGGIDKLIIKTLPSYIKGDGQDVPDYIKRRNQAKKDKEDGGE